jgi:hypothetical protein
MGILSKIRILSVVGIFLMVFYATSDCGQNLMDLRLFIFYEILENLFEQYLPEHSIKSPSQSPNKFASSCQI